MQLSHKKKKKEEYDHNITLIYTRWIITTVALHSINYRNITTFKPDYVRVLNFF
jgi:hypothetical protein